MTSTAPLLPVMLKALTLLLVLSLATSQSIVTLNPTSGPKTLEEELTFEPLNGPLNGFNRYTSFISSRNIVRAQTPILVRWGLMFLIPYHDVQAACDPRRLSFFATNDTMDAHLCSHPLSRKVIIDYATAYIYRHQYPVEGYRLTKYLMSLGLTPLSKSNNMSTANGFANFLGRRTYNYFKNDGWNVLGAPRDDFGQPFYDRTGYKPVNAAGVPEKKLKYPLRWQPLTQTDKLGNFFVQKHVSPHIGLTAKPLLMPREELLKRKTKGPYRYPNRRKLHPMDRKQILRESRRLFSLSSRLTVPKIQETFFWDNKYFSTGSTSYYYCLQFVRQGIVKPEDVSDCLLNVGLSENLAMHDATILTWHEKRRHDSARPQTIIRHLFSRKKCVFTFRGFGRGYGRVRAVEWEPLIPPQPHSEYPSGSAMLCTANFEAQDLTIREFLKLDKNATIPPLDMRNFPPTAVPNSPTLDRINFFFNTPAQMGRRCAKSRLWAGVHFSQSVRDGAKAVKGIGTIAHNFVHDLSQGRVPKYCSHCLNK